jgi:hypothetical protein
MLWQIVVLFVARVVAVVCSVVSWRRGYRARIEYECSRRVLDKFSGLFWEEVAHGRAGRKSLGEIGRPGPYTGAR